MCVCVRCALRSLSHFPLLLPIFPRRLFACLLLRLQARALPLFPPLAGCPPFSMDGVDAAGCSRVFPLGTFFVSFARFDNYLSMCISLRISLSHEDVVSVRCWRRLSRAILPWEITASTPSTCHASPPIMKAVLLTTIPLSTVGQISREGTVIQLTQTGTTTPGHTTRASAYRSCATTLRLLPPPAARRP